MTITPSSSLLSTAEYYTFIRVIPELPNQGKTAMDNTHYSEFKTEINVYGVTVSKSVLV